jgi:hypothetical protein
MVIKPITETKWRKHKDAAQMNESKKYIVTDRKPFLITTW